MTSKRSPAEHEFRQQLVVLLPRLRRFALSLTSNMADADDLVQAGCEHALSRRHQFKPGSRLDSWMFSIIHHLLIDETRTMRRKKPHLQYEERHLPKVVINGMKKLEAKFQLQDVYAAMQKLNDGDRMIISLVCIDGMSYKDAANTLKVPLGTVMSRLARARKKLYTLVHQHRVGTDMI